MEDILLVLGLIQLSILLPCVAVGLYDILY